jgi:hypothetical protein
MLQLLHLPPPPEAVRVSGAKRCAVSVAWRKPLTQIIEEHYLACVDYLMPIEGCIVYASILAFCTVELACIAEGRAL